jgi:hypothetical protein
MNSNIRGGVPARILAMSTGQVVDAVEEAERLSDWSNSVANRMGDNFDGDEGQEAIIDRWLDLVEERLRIADPAWHRYLFQSGPNPDNDDDYLMDVVRKMGTHKTPRGEAPPAGPIPWRPL